MVSKRVITKWVHGDFSHRSKSLPRLLSGGSLLPKTFTVSCCWDKTMGGFPPILTKGKLENVV